MRTNTSCHLATSGMKTAGSATSRRSDPTINWHFSPNCVNVTGTQFETEEGNLASDWHETKLCLHSSCKVFPYFGA